MGFFDKALQKAEESAKAELEKLLIAGEVIEHFTLAKEDYFAITNKRLVFVNNSFTSSKKATTGVAFSKIHAVSLKRGGAFTLTKEIIVQVGSKDIEVELYDADKAVEIFKLISERIL